MASFTIDPSTATDRRARSSTITKLGADLFILGAGIAGVTAAIEAARLGINVVVADAAATLGGQSVGSLIGTLCGIFANGPDPRQLTFGIASEILHDLQASGSLRIAESRRNTKVVRYRHSALLRWMEDKISDCGVTPLLRAVLTDCTLEGRLLRSVRLATPFGAVEVAADWFVDASGDAALAWQAGLSTRTPAAYEVFGSQNCVLSAVDHRVLEAVGPDAVSARLREKADHYGLDRKDAFFFSLPGTDDTILNMTHVATPLDPIAATKAAILGHEKVDRGLAFLRAEFPQAFGHAVVAAYGSLGARQTRWIVGQYQLAADDVRNGTEFSDAVARCSWPIELHHTPSDLYWEEFSDDHVHYVPLRSLIHAEADNLLAAGRCIDGDLLALSSVRVMGPCIAMGTAVAHAIDIAGSEPVKNVDLARLRERLTPNLTS